MTTGPVGGAGTGPVGGAGSGPGRISDRALVAIFTALPCGLAVVLAIATAIAGRGA